MTSRILIGLAICAIAAGPAFAGDAADALQDSFLRRTRINRVGMSVLGGWAVANIVGGTALSFTELGDPAFHQMNALWNTVNLGLAGFGLYQAYRGPQPATLAQEIRAQHAIEKVLLVNAGLDVAYIATGFFLTQLESGPMAENYPGWGRALMLQGGFLLIFDVVMYAIHSRSRPYERALP